jgi:hypothetical protein
MLAGPAPLKTHTDDMPVLPPPAPHAAIRFVPAFRAVMPMGGCHRRAQPIVLRADRKGIWVLFGSLSLLVRGLQRAPESVVSAVIPRLRLADRAPALFRWVGDERGYFIRTYVKRVTVLDPNRGRGKLPARISHGQNVWVD